MRGKNTKKIIAVSLSLMIALTFSFSFFNVNVDAAKKKTKNKKTTSYNMLAGMPSNILEGSVTTEGTPASNVKYYYDHYDRRISAQSFNAAYKDIMPNAYFYDVMENEEFREVGTTDFLFNFITKGGNGSVISCWSDVATSLVKANAYGGYVNYIGDWAYNYEGKTSASLKMYDYFKLVNQGGAYAYSDQVKTWLDDCAREKAIATGFQKKFHTFAEVWDEMAAQMESVSENKACTKQKMHDYAYFDESAEFNKIKDKYYDNMFVNILAMHKEVPGRAESFDDVAAHALVFYDFKLETIPFSGIIYDQMIPEESDEPIDPRDVDPRIIGPVPIPSPFYPYYCNYQDPKIITYKVALLNIGHYMEADDYYFKSKNRGSSIYWFGSDNTAGGETALENLYNKSLGKSNLDDFFYRTKDQSGKTETYDWLARTSNGSISQGAKSSLEQLLQIPMVTYGGKSKYVQ